MLLLAAVPLCATVHPLMPVHNTLCKCTRALLCMPQGWAFHVPAPPDVPIQVAMGPFHWVSCQHSRIFSLGYVPCVCV